MRRLAFLAVGVLLGAGAGAQQPAAAPSAKPAAKPDAPLTIEMKEVEIRGEVERPEVFYIIPRKEARLAPAPLSKDFSAELGEPLLPGPFEESVRRSQAKKP